MSTQPVIKNVAATDLRQVLLAALQAAADFGATAAEADIGAGHGLSVSVRQGEPENVEHQRDKGLSLTVYVGQRKGSASSTDLGLEAVRGIARSACDIARHASPDWVDHTAQLR